MTTPDQQAAGEAPLRRPDLERTEPLRNIFNAFRQEDGRGKAPFSDDAVWAQFRNQQSEPYDQGADTRPPNSQNGGADWQPGPVWPSASESVKAGYAVLDQQVREGQRAAETFGARDSGLGNRSISSLLNRLVRTYSDIGAVWVDLLMAATEREGQAATSQTADPAQTEHASTGSAVAVQLTASSPVTARARLYRGVRGKVIALPLRGVGPEMPDIADLSVVAGPMVQLGVPANTPPGQYHGILLEEGAEEPVGSVSLTVHEAASG